MLRAQDGHHAAALGAGAALVPALTEAPDELGHSARRLCWRGAWRALVEGRCTVAKAPDPVALCSQAEKIRAEFERNRAVVRATKLTHLFCSTCVACTCAPQVR